MLSLLTDKYEDLLKQVEKSNILIKFIIMWISGIILCIPIFEAMRLSLGLLGIIFAYIIFGLILGLVFNFVVSVINYIIFNIAKADTTFKKVQVNTLISFIPFFLVIAYVKGLELVTRILDLSGDAEKLFNLANISIIILLIIYHQFLVFKWAISYNKANPLWLGIVSFIMGIPFFFFMMWSLWAWLSMMSYWY